MVTLLSRALDRKLVRELWRLRTQLVSIALVVATAVMTVVTMRGTYESLFTARANYYATSRFADVWATLERAPTTTKAAIERIPGVDAVETRVSTFATLDLPWLESPGLGLFVSVPEHGRPRVNDVHIASGRYIAPGRSDEALVSKKFLDTNDLALGDTVIAVLNGSRRGIVIVGTAMSPEHSYSIPPGALYPEDDRYGVFWTSEATLGPSLDMEGGFNEAVLTLTPDASESLVLRELDRVLDPYGGRGAYMRADQPSHQILDNELESNRSMGTVVPIVFLGVAAFLLNLVLGRLIATQRTEIGTLKAFGYTDREIGWHFLHYALVAVGVGTVAGAIFGALTGNSMVQLYGEYFNLPFLRFELSWRLVWIGSLVSLGAAVTGAGSAVRSATSLAPAEAMRPESPPKFKAGWVERMGAGSLLSASGRLVLRNMERRPGRVALSALGVSFSVAILVIGVAMLDGIDLMMDIQFRVAQREDMALSFNRPVGHTVTQDLENLRGVTRAEPYYMVPVRLRSGHREREVGITGLDPDAELRHVVDSDSRIRPLPMEHILISKLLADALRISRGDMVEVEVLIGERREVDVRIAGVVEDFLGVSAYMTIDGARALSGEGRVVSGAHLSVDPGERGWLNSEMKQLPAVAGVASPQAMLDSFEKQMGDSLYVAIGFLLGFAGIISIAIIYNGTRIALSERARELASLRVLGFSQREVAELLLGEQAVITLAAIPLGWWLGYALTAGIATAMASETYRLAVVMGPRTYLVSGIVTIVFALGSGMLVRRRMDRMDLISVLKTRE